MILIIDNYDSFVFNLARYVNLAGMETKVVRNDKISVSACLKLNPSGLIISPGPKTPGDAGVCMALLEAWPRQVPVLGVCLGHQCLVEHFGGITVRADVPLHGEASTIDHDQQGLFKGLKSPLKVGRYHSLISKIPRVSDTRQELDVCAKSLEGEIMAVRHKHAAWFGVQFHPESVLTPEGQIIVKNFIDICHVRQTI